MRSRFFSRPRTCRGLKAELRWSRLAGDMRVREAASRADIRRFISFPRTLYRDDPLWAHPLWADERGAYSPRKNAILAHSDYALLLAEEGPTVLGRSLVYVDR